MSGIECKCIVEIKSDSFKNCYRLLSKLSALKPDQYEETTFYLYKPPEFNRGIPHSHLQLILKEPD